MKIFLFSSPYQYYADNLAPLHRFLIIKGCQVWGSYRLSENGTELSFDGKKVDYSNQILSGKIKPDAIVITQCWWYQEAKLVDYARKNKIPFYIVDHAAPMMKYTQKDGKGSHLYRKDLRGARCFFAYGPATKEVMRIVGCKENIEVVGSSRIEAILKKPEEERRGYVLFDTSNKMDDDSLVKKFLSFVESKPDEQFFIQEHSRSPKFYRKALKYPNVSLNTESEVKLSQYSDFIFSFPSSGMLVPAILNKRIYALYDTHFCLEARDYYDKYQDTILSLGKEEGTNFKKFISANILYNDVSANKRIYDYIKKDLK